tara:strand:+ start:352 stop:2550 length:2199 start_codon:yes stop_codon:yes gene_type:complete
MSNTGIKYLLKELSAEFGIIDFTQPVQTAYLFNLMQDLNIPTHLIQETITKLTEKDESTPLDDKEKEKAKRMGLVSLGYGNYGKEKGGETTHKNVDGKIVPVDDDKGTKTDTEEKPEVKPKITKIKDNPFGKEKKLTKTQIKINDTINKLGIEKEVLDKVDETFKKDFNSIISQVSKNIDKIDDTSKQIVTEAINSISVLYSKASDEDKVKALSGLNVSASPNRKKLYLDDLRGQGDLYKVLGATEATKRLVEMASEYADIPEDDNKVAQNVEKFAKPDIGGESGARTVYKKKSNKYIDEINDPNVEKLFKTPPLDRIIKPAFKSMFGPTDSNGNLLIPSSENSEVYFKHSIENNNSLDKTANYLEELASEGKVSPKLAESIKSHKNRLISILNDYEVPSDDARKAVERSYATLADELHNENPDLAGRMLKQFAEMAQYDSEIAGGDECYLPGHGSFPAGDKLLFEKGRTTGKQVSFVSIKYGKYGDVYGCPANGSALQQIHPDETKRNSLGQYVGETGKILAVNDELISDVPTAKENINELLEGQGLENLFSDDEASQLAEISVKTKEITEKIKKEATNEEGKIDWALFNKLREKNEQLNELSIKLRKICPQDKFATMVGKGNARGVSKRMTPDIFLSGLVLSNQIKTSNGYELIKHNKQYMKDGEYKDVTIDGSVDMDEWFINFRMKRTPGRNGGGAQCSCVGKELKEKYENEPSYKLAPLINDTIGDVE